MTAHFLHYNIVYLLKIKSMNKEDIMELKEIVQQAKRLEELIMEIEGPLTEEQSKNLSHEFFGMGAVSVRPIDDVVSRIDSALHHPEEYL